MAERVEIRWVTCPPNTPQAAALETDLSFPAGEVSRVEIVIPRGHAGITGIALAQAHGIIVPAPDGAWIFGNDETVPLDLSGYLNNGSWSAFTYNLSTSYPHSWQLRFHVDEIVTPAPAPALLSLGQINLAGALRAPVGA